MAKKKETKKTQKKKTEGKVVKGTDYHEALEAKVKIEETSAPEDKPEPFLTKKTSALTELDHSKAKAELLNSALKNELEVSQGLSRDLKLERARTSQLLSDVEVLREALLKTEQEEDVNLSEDCAILSGKRYKVLLVNEARELHQHVLRSEVEENRTVVVLDRYGV